MGAIRTLLALALATALLAPAAQADQSPLLAMFDTDHDGRVSLAEYMAYMDQGFQRMDRNGNQILEVDELPAGTHPRQPLTLAQHHRNVRAQFHRQDSNHDGWLSLKELMAPPR